MYQMGKASFLPVDLTQTSTASSICHVLPWPTSSSQSYLFQRNQGQNISRRSPLSLRSPHISFCCSHTKCLAVKQPWIFPHSFQHLFAASHGAPSCQSMDMRSSCSRLLGAATAQTEFLQQRRCCDAAKLVQIRRSYEFPQCSLCCKKELQQMFCCRNTTQRRDSAT